MTDGPDDSLRIDNGSKRVWVDHCSFEQATDHAVELQRRSTDVTLSYNRVRSQNRVFKLGANDIAQTGESVIRVTMHHNYFDGTQRLHPEINHGRVHSFNNVISRWTVGVTPRYATAQVLSEANIFEAGTVTRAFFGDGMAAFRSLNDLTLNGATNLSFETGAPTPNNKIAIVRYRTTRVRKMT